MTATPYTFTDLGFWTPYKPPASEIPSDLPSATLFLQDERKRDWYLVRNAMLGILPQPVFTLPPPGDDPTKTPERPAPLVIPMTGPATDVLYMTALPREDGRFHTQAIQRDISCIFPHNCLLIRIEGVPLSQDKPWQLFEQQLFDRTTLTLSPLPVVIPPVISDGQFFGQLALDGVITFAEAEATSDGTIPDLLLNVINAISDETLRFKVRMKVRTATSYERTHPYTLLLAQALGWSDTQLDHIWLEGSKL